MSCVRFMASNNVDNQCNRLPVLDLGNLEKQKMRSNFAANKFITQPCENWFQYYFC